MADFSARCETLQKNERIKHFVSVLTAWGNALAIAAVARIGLSASFDFNSLTWLIAAALMPLAVIQYPEIVGRGGK